ncbi:triacylglycerol lipase 2 isoform X1 [Sorghum bicolor]|uniref:triacylglycerol lipase 2 isoform X1 n=1 Tax=Sorghum bicolor TaxID=4558 RepID=UPI0001A87DA4|nr:triacylglycerol lipase 2 isoform X1 [Sorghum bicolor]|eukprot:XP_002444703.1 triacylglycerol lipase 2 isoform X1 [Sorghum bicolor]
MGTAAVALALLFLSSTLRLAVVVGARVIHQPYGGGGGGGPCALAVAPLGYTCEEHQVTTADGYILSLQRIPRGRGGGAAGGRGGGGASSSRAGQPVLLQHGVLVDGMSWLLASPEESLPFILADRGFDVWIANNRGTRWSRRHVSLDPSSRLYWNWSWDDLVVNDLPAMVDFVNTQTGQKPHYIGHSMGTLVALAAFSEGRVVDQLKSAALLTPVAYLAHITTPIGILLAKAFVGEALSDLLGVAEFDPVAPPVTNLIRAFCRRPGMNCYDLLGSITGKNYCLNSSAVDVFLKYEPQPTSTKTMVHFAQTVRDGVLTKYDYVLPERNIASYGQAEPPVYEMSGIPAGFPLFLSYGGRDSLADPADVRLLLQDLRGHDRDKLTVQYLDQFAHLDFIIGVCAKDYVYKDMIAFLNRFN